MQISHGTTVFWQPTTQVTLHSSYNGLTRRVLIMQKHVLLVAATAVAIGR